jgi:hypothetical protein
MYIMMDIVSRGVASRGTYKIKQDILLCIVRIIAVFIRYLHTHTRKNFFPIAV